MIVELHSPADPRFYQLLEIYHEAFSPAFREPDERLVEELKGRYRLPFRFLVWDDDGVAGFIRFTYLPETQAGFVIHLAVAPHRQKEGIGRKLLTAAREALDGGLLLAEVEPGKPLEWWTRKIRVEVVTETYTQPALRPDTEAEPLFLVARGSFEDGRKLVERFYQEVWELPSDHPYVVRAVAGCAT